MPVTTKRGFTLLELVVTMAILAIVAAMALPAWQTFIANERINTARDNLVTALNLARATAVSDDNVVTVCGYNAAATNSCAASWSSGWAVIEQQGASAVLIKAAPAGSGAVPVLSALSSSVVSVSFNPRPPFVPSSQTGDFKFCDSRGASSALSLNLQSTGYVQTAASAGYTLAGVALTCP